MYKPEAIESQTMHVSVVGSGYIGTTIAAWFAELGHTVTNVDIDDDVVTAINDGKAPIHEPGLDELMAAYGGESLVATTDYDELAESDLTFLALPTPSNDDGSIDLSAMNAAAESLGEVIATKENDHLVVVKSTVIPGTTAETIAPILEDASGKTVGDEIQVAMNPEFLREGYALEDFKDPDKIVIGAEDEQAVATLNRVYEPLVEAAAGDPAIVETGIREAEMIKYANNAFLATKISLINELGNICKEYGVDAYEVADAIALDHRIDGHFLRSGLGWGGSCFPKDVAAIRAAAREREYDPVLLDATVEINDRQPERLLDLLDDHTDVAGRRVAVMGLSFKPGTDDIRYTRAAPVIDGLQERDAEIVAYDPVAIENMREKYPDIEYADSAANALEGADAALFVTDWDEFAALDTEFDAMADPIVIDGRRIVDRRDGIEYDGLTW